MTYPPPTIVPIAVAARRLRVRERWLRAEADAGRVPCLRAEDRYLVDPEAVERALLERARHPLPQKEMNHADRLPGKN